MDEIKITSDFTASEDMVFTEIRLGKPIEVKKGQTLKLTVVVEKTKTEE